MKEESPKGAHDHRGRRCTGRVWGPGTRGRVALQPREEGPWLRGRQPSSCRLAPQAGWPAQERGAGSWHAPTIRMESWPEPERTSGVYKNVPPRGASASRDSEDFHSFPYLPLRKISRSSYSEMQYGSKPPTENSDPKKKVTRSKIFLIWPVAQRNSILFTWLLSWGIKA